MTGFDHREAGTAEDAWQLADLELLAMPFAGSRVVVLAAHPDDETLGAGGLIAACTRRGVDVSVIVASDGEGSHPHSPTVTPDQLAVMRRVEVQAAIDVVAPGAFVQFLGLPDGGLAQNHTALRDRVEHFARTATHIISPWSGDRHPDHEACAAAAAQVAQRHGIRHWQYPIWAWHWADPDSDDLPRERLRRLPLTTGDLAAKIRALNCHESQRAPLSDAPGDEPILSAEMMAHFTRPMESFVVAAGIDAASPGYFDELYGGADDPWGLADRFYEQRKRGIEFASLPRRRFGRAFEPGCAIGLLTEQLATRCDEVVAWDVAENAVHQTRERVAGKRGVRVEQRQIPDDWPDGEFDLIMLSEVAYYCVDLDLLVDRVLGSLTDDGVVLACDWRRPAPDHPHTAEAVHTAIDARLASIVRHVEDDFVLQIWTRSGRSVASEDGVVE